MGTKKLKDVMSAADWQIVSAICARYKVDPILIAAIGWHETHWGRLGAGRRGWVLGYGYYPGSQVAERYRGVAKQVRGACRMIKKWLKQPVDYDRLLEFAKEHWRPGNPEAWAKSVWQIYTELKRGEEAA